MELFYFITCPLIYITVFSPSLRISEADSFEMYLYKALLLEFAYDNDKMSLVLSRNSIGKYSQYKNHRNPFRNLLDRLNRMTIAVDKNNVFINCINYIMYFLRFNIKIKNL